MCLSKIVKWLVGTPLDNPPVESPTEPLPILSIPHPEEEIIPLATIEATDINQVFNDWLEDWQVNPMAFPFWLTVNIEVSNKYLFPAGTMAETKQMWIRPEWANPGVIAHEMAHISYSLLSQEDKSKFPVAFLEALETDDLLQLVYSTKPYMRFDDIETHADCYRYLGQQMPKSLKRFYPYLF